MTTSSTNNSVFRGFFEKQKLTGPNFIDWYRQLRIMLSIEDKLNYLEQPIPPFPVAPNYNMHSMGKTVNKLNAMLKLHEQTLPKSNAPALNAIRAGKNHGKGKNKQAYAPKPKIPPPPKREDRAKDSICHECREIGHWKRNCPQYLAELMKKKKNTASGVGGSGIFVIELNTILNRSWIYDTGCTHICNTMQGLRASRKLKPGLLACTWAMVNMKLLKQFNKRAKLDLDSALLWHSRLGHISKKRIEKLQHDGLLDSSVLRAFKKCVSCMSGKMARKLYTHQVERAKDLLRLIHTDVCGLFKIMSRQGHKHEVFETFKVFQKEVENQLDNKKEKTAIAFLYQALPEEQLIQITKHKTAKAIWDALKTRHIGEERVQQARLQTLKSDIEMLHMKEDETIDTFTGKLTTLVNKAASLGHTMEYETLVHKLLNAVPERYLQIVASMEKYSDLSERTLKEAIGRLKTYEERIKYKKDKQVDNQEKLRFA
nr:zinc finger, CCHC-type [Tanacetum cinerariifolium]